MRFAAALIVAGLVVAPPARAAEDPEVAALRTEVAQVRAHLEAIEGRLKALEARDAAAVPATAAAVTGASNGPALARAPAPVVAAASPAPVAAPSAASMAPAPAAPAAAPASSAVASGPDRAAWRQVREGLTQTEVESLLGAPARRFELSGKWVSYYVYPGRGAGSVFFDGAGQVSSVQRPSGM